jgi:hypothetical protein
LITGVIANCPRKCVCCCRAGLVVVVIKRDRRTGVIAIPHQNAFVGIVVKRVLLTVGINNNKNWCYCNDRKMPFVFKRAMTCFCKVGILKWRYCNFP